MIVELNNIESFSSWEKWKKTLAKAVSMGETVGMSDETISKIGYRIGNMLSANVDPENHEHRLLQQLWRVGDDSDRLVIAKLIVRMVQNEHMH
jgi:hypothetical protein